MPTEDWLAAASAAAYLALALLAAARRARHPLAAHLGLMSVGLFAYNLHEVLSVVTGQHYWVWLGELLPALIAIATFELFVGFLGATRRLTRVRWSARVYFGLLGMVGLLPLVLPRASVLRESGVWALLMLVGLLPCFAVVGVLLVRHARRFAGKERLRAQLMGGALLLGVGSVMTDLASMSGLQVPRLSSVGLLLASLLMAAFAFESRIIERVTIAAGVNALIVSLLAVAAQVVLLSWARDRTALIVFGTVVVALGVVAALVPTLGALSDRRVRNQYVLTLGRFAQQMAHDVRNPLAAIKGSAQFLKQERAEGRSMDPHEEMIDLIVERVDRIETFIRDYQRMGRMEPSPTSVDLRALVEAALRLAATGVVSNAKIRVACEVTGDLPMILADPDLLGFALENVVRNACEAMPNGGEIHASILRSGTADLRIRIRDSGAGMDVRTIERALQGFFTNKEGGTGLGLTFVRKVVEAHGGRFGLESEEGRSTTVEIELPIAHVFEPLAKGNEK